jgi:hypothetical protein
MCSFSPSTSSSVNEAAVLPGFASLGDVMEGLWSDKKEGKPQLHGRAGLLYDCEYAINAASSSATAGVAACPL